VEVAGPLVVGRGRDCDLVLRDDGIAPRPFVTRSTTRSFDGLELSRFGPTLPEVPASDRVWHEPHVAVKIDLPSVGCSAVTPVPATAPT